MQAVDRPTEVVLPPIAFEVDDLRELVIAPQRFRRADAPLIRHHVDGRADIDLHDGAVQQVADGLEEIPAAGDEDLAAAVVDCLHAVALQD